MDKGLPPPNPIYGGAVGSYSGVYVTVLGLHYQEMGWFTIARHGKRPSPLPRQWDVSQPLFGAINLSFFDGHAEQVRLEKLWQLHWYKDYVPPAKRPGLK